MASPSSSQKSNGKSPTKTKSLSPDKSPLYLISCLAQANRPSHSFLQRNLRYPTRPSAVTNLSIPSISRRSPASSPSSSSPIPQSISWIVDYLLWLARAWRRVAFSLPRLVFSPIDAAALVGMALLASVLLGILLVIDILIGIPIVNRYYIQIERYLILGPSDKSGFPTYLKQFPESIKSSANQFLAAPPEDRKPDDFVRTVDLDATKYLLALASIIYLHEENLPVHSQDDEVRQVANAFGLQYRSLTALSRTQSAVVGAFYIPGQPFLVLAFKGTAADQFDEWLVDFDYEWVQANEYLEGYKGVHRGFFDALYYQATDQGKDEASNAKAWDGKVPNDFIRLGILGLVRELQSSCPGKSINIWTTGHSLGAALSSAWYARAVQRPEDFQTEGETSDVIVRDAYLFGAPIFADPYSLNAFNHSLSSDDRLFRSCWRITNHHDAIATLLPSFGDRNRRNNSSSTLSRTNQFNYAHVGENIDLQSSPKYSTLGEGTQLVWSTPVELASQASQAEAALDLDKKSGKSSYLVLPGWLPALQRVPLFGRLLAHAPILYAKQLDEVRPTTGAQSLPWIS